MWREPSTILDLKAFGWLQSCNINYSGVGGGAGRKLVHTLSDHNINVYTDYGQSRNEKDYPFFDFYTENDKARYNQVYDYFFIEFISAFNHVQYSWIRNI